MVERQAFGKDAQNAREVLNNNERLSQSINQDLGSLKSIRQDSNQDDYTTASVYLPKIDMYDSAIQQANGQKPTTLL